MSEPVSAQVILQPGAPDVRDWFRSLGFEVSAVYASSFAITGPASLFASMPELPAGVRRSVVEIATSPPPDFGPGSY